MKLCPVLSFVLLFASPLACAEELNPGIDRRGMDPTVRPQDDLFQAANGEWLKHTPIPVEKPTYGAFEILADEAQLHVREIIKNCTEGDFPPGSNEQKIGDFFQSYMDLDKVEQLGIEPLRAELAKIDEIENTGDLVRYWGYLQTIGVDSPIGFYVDQDDKNSQQYIAVVIQSGISLPDRDYYLEQTDEHKNAREGLKRFVTTVFELAELPAEPSLAAEILALETAIAEIQWERVELRNAEKRYNKFTRQEWLEKVPGLDWEGFFSACGVGDVTELNVNTPSFFESLQGIVEESSLDLWKQYHRYRIIDAYAMALPKKFVDANFDLYSKQLRGVKEIKPRWKRAVDAIAGARGMGALGDAIGQIYVRQHYPPEAKQRMEVLVKNLMVAFDQSIDQLEWMTPDTKEKAHQKLSKIKTKIGHTRKWRDYSQLEVKPDDLVGNMIRSATVEHQRSIGKLGGPVDREEWFMTPQTVNAYYNPSMNEIVFPAAILQPPYFDFTADDAANYGGIGAIIGHEISHAFDDQGSKYDGDGNLENWWTPQDRVAFTELTGKLVDQYDSYAPLKDRQVNGKLTLGENIADLSGLAVAYKAFELSLDGEQSPVIDGWTGPQRFFLSWSQSWRRKYTNPEMLRRLTTDPHSPPAYRSNGPVVNFSAFYQAFRVESSDGMFKPEAERIQIW